MKNVKEVSIIPTQKIAKMCTLETPDHSEQLLPRTVVEAIQGIDDYAKLSDIALKADLDSTTHKVKLDQLPEMNYDPVGSAAGVEGKLVAHAAEAANPHRVTAAQVGADTVGSSQAVYNELNTHAGSRNNPHGVNSAQIGAAEARQISLDEANSMALKAGIYHINGEQVVINGFTSAFWTVIVGAGYNAQALTQIWQCYEYNAANILFTRKATSEAAWSGFSIIYTGDNRPTAADVAADPVGSAAAVDGRLFSHTGDATRHITAAERAAWNIKETPEGAQSRANTAEVNAKAASRPVSWVPAWGDVMGKPATFPPISHSHTAAEAGADPAGSATGVQNGLNGHMNNRSNPHGVTAQQAGALPISGGTMTGTMFAQSNTAYATYQVRNAAIVNVYPTYMANGSVTFVYG